MGGRTKRTFGEFCDPLAAGTGDGCRASRLLPVALPMAEPPQPELPIELALPVGDSMLLLSLGDAPKLPIRRG